MKKLHNVCVLFGGVSTEHLISCRSAYNIIQGLVEAGLEVAAVGMTKEGEFLRYLADLETLRSGEWEEAARAALAEAGAAAPSPADIASPAAFLAYHCGGTRPDVVFPAVHGINCEDGVLQGFLEMCAVPYVGSGVLASAAGMDKSFAKIVFEAAGIPQVPFAVARRADIRRDPEGEAEKLVKELGLPLFLKPANGGSSVGTTAAKTAEALAASLQTVAEFDEKVLVERFVDAREIEVAVMGNREPRAALPGEIVKEADIEYYDYETKYFKQGAVAAVPADIPASLKEEISALALRAYQALGCSGLSRVDFFLEKGSGKLYLNEINTLPGFTSISLYPLAWQKSGLDTAELLRELCCLALERSELTGRRTRA
ncbi:MAG: D-alanine--D-alanine ligase [Clostridiaceae bacterium]|nr:D-alanine--D-alanine ligase [Clostridiaceae bacterium]